MQSPSGQGAPKDVPETDDLKRFREAWREEVRMKKGVPGTISSNTKKTLIASEDAGPSGATPVLPQIPDSLPTSTNEITSGHSEEDTRPTSHLAAAIATNNTRSPAVAIYRQAVLHEQKGELDEALHLYRQAFRREPNVDKLYHQEERLGAFLANQAQNGDRKREGTGTGKKAEIDLLSIEMLSENVKHTLAFQDKTAEGVGKGDKRRSRGDSVSNRLTSIVKRFPDQLTFEPEDEKEPVHLNLLPDEMIVHVVKNLDPTSIERFAAVNRKARLISLDASLWKCVYSLALSCSCSLYFRELVDATYKPPQIPDKDVLLELYDQYLYDFRRLYIEQPRVRMDGVYIAVCHYV